ncbi:MAG: serine/threonine-protein kinase [bacterium]
MQPPRPDDPEAISALDTIDAPVDLAGAPDEAFTLASPIDPRSRATPTPPEYVPLIRLAGPSAEGDYELRERIGEGGMGAVHLGWQRSVGREVAVKIPHGGSGRASRIAALVREARFTGRLEHPNIVPLHGLGRTSDGATVMVMKRVEGVTWREVVDDPRRLPERFRGDDPLETHLRILMEVCDAIHFAHSRGVLHRDIKLDNVLIGGFGEVYVVDWGIAVALEDDGTGHLPLAADVQHPAGTPGYMAPEMAAGDGARLGPHSDVYCLGATLHRILTGQARHTGASYLEVLAHSFESAPFDYGPFDLPRELTAICARATAADPAARYRDVPAFRRAVTEFLAHRSSARLVDEAAAARAAFAAAVAAGGEDADRHFGAARFALEHALRIWPENAEARAALDAVLLDGAERALAMGRGAEAEQLVSAVVSTEFAVVVRRDALLTAIEADWRQRQALGRLAREVDVGVFTRHRGVVALILGLLWTANGLRRGAEPPTVEALIVDQLWMLGAIVTLVVVLRRWLWGSGINRKVSSALVGIVVMDLAIRLAGAALGLAAPVIAALEMVVDFGGVMFLALLVDRRILLAAAAMAVGAAYGLTHLDRIFDVTALNTLVALSLIGVTWLRRPPRE